MEQVTTLRLRRKENRKTYSKGDYIVNHHGQVYDITINENIYQAPFDQACEFVDTITAE